jgi:hypothetical protein
MASGAQLAPLKRSLRSSSLCTELAVIAHGRIRFAGTTRELRAGHAGFDYRLRVTDAALAQAAAAGMDDVEVTFDDGKRSCAPTQTEPS